MMSKPKKLKKGPKFVKKQKLVNGDKEMSKTSGRLNKLGSEGGSATKANKLVE